MEETNNQELIGRLYALRAGLSVISEEADKLSSAEDEATQKYLTVSQTAIGGEGETLLAFVDEYDRVSAFPTEISRFVHENGYVSDGITHNRKSRPVLNEIIQNEQCYNCTDRNDEAYYEQQEKARVCYAKWLGTGEGVQYYEQLKDHYCENKKTGKGLGIAALVIAFLAIGAAVGLALLHLYIFTAIAGVVALIGIGIGILGLRGKSEKKQVAVINNLLSYIPIAQQEMKSAENRLAETAKDIKDLSSEIYTALENEFSALIDPRDWQYLDLVIFYFETGRAETMKEALQLVEREVQTQRIVGAIEMASERVCRTIATAAIVISSRLSIISSQLGVAIKQQEMQNALLAKSGATSESLMRDVKYIKNYVTKK